MTYQLGTQFMQKIVPLMTNLLMQSCNADPRLPAVMAALLFTGQRLLRPSQLACLCAIPARVLDYLARREDSQRFQSDVNTNMHNNRPVGARRICLLGHQADVPVSA